MTPLAMNSATGKRLLALVREGDYAHPGEEEAIHLLLAGLRPDARRRVLDAGCGGGGTAAWIQGHGYGAVAGIDIDAETVRLAGERHPQVQVVAGDLQRAGDVLSGPFSLIYSMTALYAVPDQRAALAQLGALAAPGAELRLLEYADPHGRFAAATSGRSSYAWWRPLDPRRIHELLAGTGWALADSRDLGLEFERWYVDLCARIAARREAIVEEFGAEWFTFARAEYAGVLRMVRAGELGGVFVRARAAEPARPLPPTAP